MDVGSIIYELSMLKKRVKELEKQINNKNAETHYEVSVGRMYLTPDKFNTYEDAKKEYEDIKTYESDAYIGLSKVTIEELESEYLPFKDDED